MRVSVTPQRRTVATKVPPRTSASADGSSGGIPFMPMSPYPQERRDFSGFSGWPNFAADRQSVAARAVRRRGAKADPAFGTVLAKDPTKQENTMSEGLFGI